MTRLVLDVSYATPEERKIAVFAFAKMRLEPRDALSSESDFRKELSILMSAMDAEVTPAALGATSHWYIRNEAWREKFFSIAAAAHDQAFVGNRARTALHEMSRDREKRLLQLGGDEFKEEEWLATLVDQDSLHLFCPKTGLWQCDIGDARTWFEDHMAEHYGHLEDAAFRSWVAPIPMLVHFTWIGGPKAETREVLSQGIKVTLRADITGCQMLSEARPDLPIWFHCQRQHHDEFTKLFSLKNKFRNVTVKAIEDSLESSQYKSLIMSKPKFQDIGKTVDYIMRELLKDGHFAFVKDVWSFYVIWLYGGYHLDTGMVRIGNQPVVLPRPSRFGATLNAGRIDPNTPPYRLMSVLTSEQDQEPLNIVLSGNPANILTGKVFSKQKNVATTANLKSLIAASKDKELGLFISREGSARYAGITDVWMLRGTHRDPDGLRALKIYCAIWFLCRKRWKEGVLSDGTYKDACRQAVVTAAQSGLATANESDFWRGNLQIGRYAIQTDYSSVKGGGLAKIGFLSHA
jgi:hypothetical protein